MYRAAEAKANQLNDYSSNRYPSHAELPTHIKRNVGVPAMAVRG